MRTRNVVCNSQSVFLQKLLENGQRMDGRKWTEFRDIEVTYDADTSSALAKLGHTRIMCSVESEIGAPRKSARPGAGSIQFFMEFLPIAHPSAGDSMALDSEVEECLTMLETLYRDTSCIDFDTLCIEVNLYVFDIKCTLRVLDYDGGLFDCATLAVTSALMGFRRNDVTYNAITKKLIVHSASEKPLIPLTMIYKPATVTFGFVKEISESIVDPTEVESTRIDGYLIIGANRRGEICLIYQYGNINVTPEMINKCSQFVIAHAQSTLEKMATAVYGKGEDVTR